MGQWLARSSSTPRRPRRRTRSRPTAFAAVRDGRGPEGLTWLPVHGQWMGGNQDSYLLILLYPNSNRQADRDIEKIRSDYKSQFGQEPVLRADSTEHVSF